MSFSIFSKDVHPKCYFLWMHTKNRRKNTVLPKNFVWHLCQYQHTKLMCSYWQGTIFLQLKSSVVMVSNPLGTCTLFSWTLTGSIIITEQSQPRNHHNSYFAWMLSLPASHIRRTFKDENTSHPINPSLPILAHLRHGAMRNCSSCLMKSSYSVVCIHQFCGHI